MAVSGGYERYFETADGTRYHHILSPETGYPAQSDILSVGVVSSDGTQADFLSTTLFVWGDARTREFMEEHPEIGVIFLNGSGELVVSKMLEESFRLSEEGEGYSVRLSVIGHEGGKTDAQWNGAQGPRSAGWLFALALLFSGGGGTGPRAGAAAGHQTGACQHRGDVCTLLLDRRTAVSLVLLKALFAALTRGVSAGALSLSGGLLSIALLMLLMLPRERPSLLILSVAGAISHNLGQLLMASLWLGTGFTLAYAPVLILSGIAMGSLTALSLRLVLPALERAGIAMRGGPGVRTPKVDQKGCCRRNFLESEKNC